MPLQKPFTSALLAHKLRAVLDEAAVTQPKPALNHF
jgi:hypothetical protein